MSNTNGNLASEIDRRRSVAIIAHPDAGKTTLTEKLLLYGGAIHRAGSIKARKADRHAKSDWMDMEQERGISITSSIMQFTVGDVFVNLLDTPGHADFSADTYRTLVAADSAVILIDGTSGVEKQTTKLFRFSREHEIPLLIFVNKMDRFTKKPLTLLDEMEEQLGVELVPFNWPIGRGRDFVGLYDFREEKARLYEKKGEHGQEKLDETLVGMDDDLLKEKVDKNHLDELREEIELLQMAGSTFDREKFLKGAQSPVFFGSAQTNFGVQQFMNQMVEVVPPPLSRGGVSPDRPEFSGYVFKIQANMDPDHRDRIAFMRICSGKYEKDMMATLVRNGKEIKLSQTRQFMGQDREIVDEAYPGDVVGLYDPGMFRIGDTLTEGTEIRYDEVPRFSPEHFAKVKVEDAFKRKHLKKGLDELSEEGAIQVFEPWEHGQQESIVGVVGSLQFEVLEYRLEEEYGVDVRLEELPYTLARWIEGDNIDPEDFSRGSYRKLLRDEFDDPLLLFRSETTFERDQREHPEVTFMDTAPLYETEESPEKTS
jgi:peptide chain release factor 3